MDSKDIDTFFLWLKIREDSGMPFPNNYSLLKIYATKSALLKRLLSGKKLLDVPPPTRNHIPWYELIEDEIAYPLEVFFPDGWMASLIEYDAVSIEQLYWKIIEKVDDFEWIIVYPYNDYGNKVFSESKWKLSWVGSRFPQSSFYAASNKLYKLELIKS